MNGLPIKCHRDLREKRDDKWRRRDINRGLNPIKWRMSAATKLIFLISLQFGLLLFYTPVVYANPEGGAVAAGSATISSPDANTVVIQQSTDKAIINWQTFNIAPGETTRFQQPNAGSIAVNRVNPNNGASTIGGNLTANGQIWILNPAGILITPTGRIDAAGFLATTAGISDADFMSGHYHFLQSPDWNGAVINEGVISIADTGMAALVAPAVHNSGVIQANLGVVALSSTNEYTIDFYGDQLIQFGLNSVVTKQAKDSAGNAMNDAVSNSGTIIANGGRVLVSANTAAGIVHNAINMSGTVVANSATVKNGVIVLSAAGSGGTVKVSGKLSASGAKTGKSGGTIKVLGKSVEVADGAVLDATGDTGGGEILIGGNAHGAGPEMNADYAIFSDTAVADASALVNGNGGNVILWSDKGTGFYGNILARGGSEGGNGGFVETSGHDYLEAYGHVDASAPFGSAGTWLLDPSNVTLSNSTARGTYSGGVFTPTGNNAAINVASINTDLNNGTNVVINTASSNNQPGNITVSSAVLKSSGSTTPSLTLNAAGTISINDTISYTSGGLDLILNSNGTISQLSPITVSGLTIAAGDGLVALTNASNNISGVLNLSNSGTKNVSVTNNAALNIGTVSVGAGSLTFTAAGAITQSGSITQASGADDVSFSAGANAITLTNASNSLIGAVSFSNSGANNVSLVNNAAIKFGTSSIGSGTFSVTSAGAITQNGAITQAASAGTASFSAGANAITLTNANNNFTGALAFSNSGANNVSFVNNSATSFGTSSLGSGTFSVTSAGAITQTGAISQAASAGTASFSAGANVITLTNASNNFTGAVALSNSGANNVSLTNNAALNIGTVSVGTGILTFNAAGAITQSGAISAASLASTSTGGAAFTNTSNAISAFQAVNSSSGDISFVTTSTPLTLNTITQNGSGGVYITISPSGGQINLGANITTNGGEIKFNNPLNLTAGVSMTSGGGKITFQDTVNGSQTLTLNSGSSGDILFNGNVGNLAQPTLLTITLAHDVTNNALMKVGQFTQNAGSLTAFGSSGITTTSGTSVSVNNVTGKINVAALTLGTNDANLTGSIIGMTGQDAIDTVTFLNTISAGTHFFNGIDMYSASPTPAPTPAPVPAPTPSSGGNTSPVPTAQLPQVVLPDRIAVYDGYIAPNSSTIHQLVGLYAKHWKTCMAISQDVLYCY